MTNAHIVYCECHKYNLTDLPSELTWGWRANVFIFISAGLREDSCCCSNSKINSLWIPVSGQSENVKPTKSGLKWKSQSLLVFVIKHVIASHGLFSLLAHSLNQVQASKLKLNWLLDNILYLCCPWGAGIITSFERRGLMANMCFKSTPITSANQRCCFSCCLRTSRLCISTSEGGLIHIDAGIAPISDRKCC